MISLLLLMASISFTFDFMISLVAADKHIEILEGFNDDTADINAKEVPNKHEKTVIVTIIILLLIV